MATTAMSQLEYSPRGRSIRTTGFRRHQSTASPSLSPAYCRIQREESPGWPLPKPASRRPEPSPTRRSRLEMQPRRRVTKAPLSPESTPPPQLPQKMHAAPLVNRLRAKASRLRLAISRTTAECDIPLTTCAYCDAECHCDGQDFGGIRVISDPVSFQHVSHASRDQYFNMKSTTQHGLLAEFALPNAIPTARQRAPSRHETRIPQRKAVPHSAERRPRCHKQHSFDAFSSRCSDVPSLVSGTSDSSCRSTASFAIGNIVSDLNSSPTRHSSSADQSDVHGHPAGARMSPLTIRTPQSFSSIATADSLSPTTPLEIFELDAVETSPAPRITSSFSFELEVKSLQDSLPQDLLVKAQAARRASSSSKGSADQRRLSKKASSRSLRSTTSGKLDYRSPSRGAEEYINRPLPPLPLAPIRKVASGIVRSPTQPTRRKPTDEEDTSSSPAANEPPLVAIVAKYQPPRHARKRSNSSPELPMARFSLFPALQERVVTVKGGARLEVEAAGSSGVASDAGQAALAHMPLPAAPTRAAPAAPSLQMQGPQDAAVDDSTRRRIDQAVPGMGPLAALSLASSPAASTGLTFAMISSDYFGS